MRVLTKLHCKVIWLVKDIGLLGNRKMISPTIFYLFLSIFVASVYHVNGTGEFNLTTTISKPASGDSWCKAFKISSLEPRERHIVQIDPVIAVQDEAKVHHIALFACSGDFKDVNLDSVYPCYDADKTPMSFKKCAARSVIFLWGKGIKSFKFPDHVGYPIGCSTCTKYVLLETYFEGKMSGNATTTGFRMHHDVPRKYPADVLTTGSRISGSMIIPPGQQKWISSAYCTKDCTAKIKHKSAINGNEIKLFAWLPHAHIGVKEIWTQKVGSEREIREVAKVDTYDENNQHVYTFKKEVSFKAGDELITYCRYDTSSNREALVGGPREHQAVCLGFFMFYPRINFSSCISQDFPVFKKFSMKYAKPVKDIGFGVVFPTADPAKAKPIQFANWTGVKWTSNMVKELKEVYAYNGPDAMKQVCMQASSNGYIDYDTFKVRINQQQCPKGVSGFVFKAKPSAVWVTVFVVLCKIKNFMTLME